MICTFGLMDFMVIYKWLHTFEAGLEPSIITLLIGLVLSPFDYPSPALWQGSQLIVNQVCIAIALVCVPMMLIPKPYLLKAKYARESMKQISPRRIINENRVNQPLLESQN